MSTKRVRQWRNFDFPLLGATLLLIAFGVAMIYSAISDSPGLQELPQRHAMYAAVGLVIMLVITTIDYRLLMDFRLIFYVVALALLGAVLFLGQTTHGAQRWLDLYLFPVQPSELARLLVIVVLAGFFANRREKIKSFSTFLFSLLLIIPPTVLIYLEPSLSTAISILVLWLTISFVAGVGWQYLVGMGAIGITLSPIVWNLLSAYQRDRFLLFLNPEYDVGARYNIDQALIAIGSGGWLGKGFALGSQSQLRFLRVRWSDFIFSVIGEELGLIGVLLLFLLLLIVILRLFRDAELARDLFGRLITIGVATIILFQAVIHISMNMGLLPATGIPLPFVSSGGSSLIALLIAQGLVQSICLRREKLNLQLASRV